MTAAVTADSHTGRVLLALRASGALAVAEAEERWGKNGAATLAMHRLAHAGEWVVKAGAEYRITPAGRAACPFRNPLAAKPAVQEVFEMPQGRTRVTRQQVLAAIVAAGPSGMTRRELIEKFDGLAAEGAIEMHMSSLNRAQPPLVYKPRPGLLIDIRLKPAGGGADEPLVAAVPESEVAKIARDYAEMIDFDIEPCAGAEEMAAETASTAAAEEVMPGAVDRDAELIRQAKVIVDLRERIAGMEREIAARDAVTRASTRYAVAFPYDFHDTIESAIAHAAESYDSSSLPYAAVIACTLLGSIAVRPTFVPLEGDREARSRGPFGDATAERDAAPRAVAGAHCAGRSPCGVPSSDAPGRT